MHVQVGATEIGQGSDTIVAQMTAETMPTSVTMTLNDAKEFTYEFA